MAREDSMVREAIKDSIIKAASDISLYLTKAKASTKDKDLIKDKASTRGTREVIHPNKDMEDRALTIQTRDSTKVTIKGITKALTREGTIKGDITRDLIPLAMVVTQAYHHASLIPTVENAMGAAKL